MTSSASVWKPWLPSVMSGPLFESSARLTVFTSELKSMNLRLILTFGYLFSKFAVICSMTSCRPGFWLSYVQTLSSTGPSDWNPLVFGGVAVGEFTPDVRANAGPVSVAAVSANAKRHRPEHEFPHGASSWVGLTVLGRASSGNG